jgi:hypothetical protein
MKAREDFRTAGGSMFQTPFFWETITLPGPGRSLILLVYWSGDLIGLQSLKFFSHSVTKKGSAGNVVDPRRNPELIWALGPGSFCYADHLRYSSRRGDNCGVWQVTSSSGKNLFQRESHAIMLSTKGLRFKTK